MVDLSQLRGCVVVQPKPTEHVVCIENGRFKPGKGFKILPRVTKAPNVWFINRVDDLREIDHREEIRALTVRVLRIRPDEGLTLETSALESLYDGQNAAFVINSIDIVFYSPSTRITVSLEINPLIFY